MTAQSQRILLTGATGQLGGYLLHELSAAGAAVTAWSGARTGTLFGIPLRPVDLRDPDATAAAFHDARPEVVVHTAALAAVADCYRDPAAARAINTAGSILLAELAATAGSRFVHLSTDLVFDGEHAPYREDDPPAPLSVYGRTKADGERGVLAFPGTVVVRVSLLFGPGLTRPTFFDGLCAALRAAQPLHLFDDEWRTPLDLRSAARALLGIASSDETGILHLGGPERLSRLEMGQLLADALGIRLTIVRSSRNGTAQPEPRPRDVSLDSSRWRSRFPRAHWPGFVEAIRVMGASALSAR